MNQELEKLLAKAHKAALIPTLPESKKEEKATSVLLATYRVVPLFAKYSLDEASFPNTKQPKVECYTEVVFDTSKNQNNAHKSLRPDGLIVVTYQGKSWCALIESKIGRNQLEAEQVESYLELAKEYNIDAVITISNQFASTPSHHPLKIQKTKAKNVGLFHYSWLSLLSSALVVQAKSEIDDPEQAFILDELIRYLDSKESGVTNAVTMDAAWKETVSKIQQEIPLDKRSPEVEAAVISWQQLQRSITLKLSQSLKEPVSLKISKARSDDLQQHVDSDIADLINTNVLKTSYSIPHAAAPLDVTANLAKRSIRVSMTLNCPKDVKIPTASINWLTRQLKKSPDSNAMLRVSWPKRIQDTHSTLENAIEDPKVLVPDGVKDLPKSIEVSKTVDLASKFTSAKNFSDSVQEVIESYYSAVGQNLSQWVAKAPKLNVEEPELAEEKNHSKLNDEQQAEEITGQIVGRNMNV